MLVEKRSTKEPTEKFDEIIRRRDEPATGPVKRRIQRQQIALSVVVIRDLRAPWRLVPLEVGRVHPQRVKDQRSVGIGKGAMNESLDGKAYQHVAGIPIREVSSRQKASRFASITASTSSTGCHIRLGSACTRA